MALAVHRLAQPERPAEPPDFSVRAFGALGDGKTLDTSAVNRAIEARVDGRRRDGTVPRGDLSVLFDSSQE